MTDCSEGKWRLLKSSCSTDQGTYNHEKNSKSAIPMTIKVEQVKKN